MPDRIYTVPAGRQMALQEKWSYYQTLTESMLRVLVDQSDTPQLLYDSMTYSLFAGGKRLRPALCLATSEMLDGTATEALKAACALEMIHTYSLIHDDLPAMDNDDMRRGKPSCHKAFGEGNAILAGDGLLTLACMTLGQSSNLKVINIVTRGALDMVSGQSLDLNGKQDAETLFSIHEKKTGALIRASILAGAYSAGANAKQVQLLTEFADHFGMLFQITDDILDVTGTPELLGKTPGKDKAENKVTFVTLYGMDVAMEEASHAADAALESLRELNLDSSFLEELTLYTRNRSW